MLLVEDDVALRRLTKVILERSGRFEVVGEAEDGEQAIDLGRQLQPSLILLDLAMPKMSGIEALPQLRRVAPAAKVVAFSMLQQDRHAPEALAKGAVAFIDKSVSSTELVRRLLHIVDQNGTMPSGGSPPGPLRLASLGGFWNFFPHLRNRPSWSG